MKYSYRTSGVCAVGIKFEVEDNKVGSVEFIGGCDGNHKGLAALVKGMEVEEAIDRLTGITCGHRSTSCPDQMAAAIKEAIK